jgi:hypothetical protein
MILIGLAAQLLTVPRVYIDKGWLGATPSGVTQTIEIERKETYEMAQWNFGAGNDSRGLRLWRRSIELDV